MRYCVSIWLRGLLVFALVVGYAGAPGSARAYYFFEDPLNANSSLPQYADRLRPMDCPALPSGGQKLNMMQTLAIVMCRNPDTRVTLEGLFSQASSLGTARSAYLPNISASLGWSKGGSFAPNFKDTSISQSSGISLGYTLFDFGRREASVDGAEYALQVAGLSYRSQLQSLISTTLQAYYNVLATTESVRAAEEAEAFAKASLDAANLRYEIGQVPISDMLQARAAYSQAQLTREQAQNQEALSKGALARLMGAPPNTPLDVYAVDEGQLYENHLEINVEQAMAKAKELRPDLAAQRASVLSSRASLRATKRSDLPSLSLSATEGSGSFDPFSNRAGRSQSIGLSVSIPIFSGFSQTYNERAAEQQVRAETAQLKVTEEDVLQDVWQTYQNYNTARQAWLTSLDALASALQLKDVALGRYQAGVGNILDLLSAQSQYSTSLQQQTSAKYTLLSSRVNLVRAMGALDLTTVSSTTPEAGGTP